VRKSLAKETCRGATEFTEFFMNFSLAQFARTGGALYDSVAKLWLRLKAAL
jgi:hypothetical protein